MGRGESCNGYMVMFTDPVRAASTPQEAARLRALAKLTPAERAALGVA